MSTSRAILEKELTDIFPSMELTDFEFVKDGDILRAEGVVDRILIELEYNEVNNLMFATASNSTVLITSGLDFTKQIPDNFAIKLSKYSSQVVCASISKEPVPHKIKDFLGDMKNAKNNLHNGIVSLLPHLPTTNQEAVFARASNDSITK